MSVSQQGNLQRKAMANNINNRITTDHRQDEQKISKSQSSSQGLLHPSPSIRRKAAANIEQRFSNSLTAGPGVSRSGSLRVPRGGPKVRLWQLQMAMSCAGSMFIDLVMYGHFTLPGIICLFSNRASILMIKEIKNSR